MTTRTTRNCFAGSTCHSDISYQILNLCEPIRNLMSITDSGRMFDKQETGFWEITPEKSASIR
jgi:hypothetical protein